jgi:dTDP-glucose pyrophosphorylase
MAGAGRRFTESGYKLPKPLLPVFGRPMAVQAALSLPQAERIIFIVLLEHVERYDADKILLNHVPGCSVVAIESLSKGQAATVRYAIPFLDPWKPVTVAACDNIHLYRRSELCRAIASPEDSCIVWTFRRDPRVERDPSAFGWARLCQDNLTIDSVSCKRPLSEQPLNDHALSGCFTFRDGAALQRAVDGIIEGDFIVNGEFYLDHAPSALKLVGESSRVFEVERYIGWGTPAEYEGFLKNTSDAAFERILASLLL